MSCEDTSVRDHGKAGALETVLWTLCAVVCVPVAYVFSSLVAPPLFYALIAVVVLALCLVATRGGRKHDDSGHTDVRDVFK